MTLGERGPDLTPAQVAGDRRWFIRGALGASAVTALLTLGSTVPWLEPISLLRSRRPSTSPNGIPINRTALAAKVTQVAEADWRITLTGPSGARDVGLAELLAMPQSSAVLPIACVEGWSATTSWTGVRIRDLMAVVGGHDQDVVVESSETSGSYRTSTLPAVYSAHPDTILALRIGGARLPLDHGYPARIIAPNRPGVLQTKWVRRLTVVS
ncbi:molybdopterin-dependent oxidoreductase [Lapillicoccus sp.]|uniref:molybdopterin-dependent oxidoreductase n=1 Tax=Lapillicoccus sp. TaxID=1909287 RepID=UPI0025F650F5|nr:molybdopterin-dependent oxidoreductase [Lapillicoccus sp.]